ncbi:MAG: Crp/Fnr family transcriptional regulator [Bryobacterales bacterium]|nr:Crp/Fnr family transcriptional regulator [Bryobacterales bacterium]
MNSVAREPAAATLGAQLAGLDGVTRLSQCRRGTALFSTGDRGDSIYYLESGRVKILKRNQDGKEVLLTIVAPGEVFGEQAAVGEDPREVCAEVLEDAVIYVVPRESFLQFSLRTPDVWHWLIRIFARRKAELERKIELFIFHEVEQRLLRSLVDLAAACGSASDGGEYVIGLSQLELAGAIGSTRETTSSALNQLSRRGLIRLQRRRVVIPSLPALESAINGGQAQSQTAGRG